MIYNDSHFIKLTRKILWIILCLSGWKIEGTFPNIPKFVVIIAPHTSLFDFWHMLNARVLLKLNHYTESTKPIKRNIYWLAKKSLFKWPIKQFIKNLGAIPVERSKSQNIVCDLAKIALTQNTFVIGIAPDGTRRNKTNIDFKWKTGFYHLSLKTKIPIVPCCISHRKKTLIISNPINLTDDFNSDIMALISFYEKAY